MARGAVFVFVAHAQAASKFPPFSWDTLPVAWHSDSSSGNWTTDELKVLTKYSAITLEKLQGSSHFPDNVRGHKGTTCQNGTDTSGCGCCEEDFLVDGARAVKAVNPKVHVFAYVNSVIAYPWYLAAQEFLKHEDYWLRDVNGTLLNNINMNSFETWYVWNHGNAEEAKLWQQQCLSMTKSGFVDGCFVDGCTKIPGPLDNGTFAAYTSGKPAMLADLEQQIPGVLICGSNGAFYPGTSGSQIQNWGRNGGKELSTREVPMLQKAVAAGKMFEAHGSAVCVHGGDPENAAVQTELAAFLVVAGEHSYYLCGGFFGTTPMWYPVYDKPLGAPLGDATLENGVYTRKFASGTVAVFNMSSSTGTIKWADASIV